MDRIFCIKKIDCNFQLLARLQDFKWSWSWNLFYNVVFVLFVYAMFIKHFALWSGPDVIFGIRQICVKSTILLDQFICLEYWTFNSQIIRHWHVFWFAHSQLGLDVSYTLSMLFNILSHLFQLFHKISIEIFNTLLDYAMSFLESLWNGVIVLLDTINFTQMLHWDTA